MSDRVNNLVSLLDAYMENKSTNNLIDISNNSGKPCFIYKHTCIINGKSYIGQTTQNPPSSRWSGVPKKPYHGKKNHGKLSKFELAINQYGWENFTHEILCRCNQDEADRIESYFIEKFDTMQNGYNCDSGGVRGPKKLDDNLHRLRVEAGKRHRISVEGKRRIGESTRNRQLGLKHSEETKQKMSKNSGRADVIKVIDTYTGEEFIYNSFSECYRAYSNTCSKKYNTWVDAAKFGRLIDKRWKVIKLGHKLDIIGRE